ITQALTSPCRSLRNVTELGALYRKVNSSVGEFATDTLLADSAALASGSAAHDSTYKREQRALRSLADHRDRVAASMKVTLARAARGIPPRHGELQSEMSQGKALLKQAAHLAAHPRRPTPDDPVAHQARWSIHAQHRRN